MSIYASPNAPLVAFSGLLLLILPAEGAVCSNLNGIINKIHRERTGIRYHSHRHGANLDRIALRHRRSFLDKSSILRPRSVMEPPVINRPPAPPANIQKKKYGGGQNRSDGVYLLSQLSTLQVTQEWEGHNGETSREFKDMLPKIMIWATGIEYPYPSTWSHYEYPPRFVLGYYRNNVIESILLARGTTPEYAPHALTFVVDFIAIDPDKELKLALPVLEKMRTMGITFRVPVDYTSIKEAYDGEIERLRNSLGDDPSFNYWVMQNSGKSG